MTCLEGRSFTIKLHPQNCEQASMIRFFLVNNVVPWTSLLANHRQSELAPRKDSNLRSSENRTPSVRKEEADKWIDERFSNYDNAHHSVRECREDELHIRPSDYESDELLLLYPGVSWTRCMIRTIAENRSRQSSTFTIYRDDGRGNEVHEIYFRYHFPKFSSPRYGT